MSDALPVQTAEGWSAKQFLVRGACVEAVAVIAALAVTLEGVLPGRWWYWALLFGSVFVPTLTVGLVWGFKAYAKEKVEVSFGYSTFWKTAVEHLELYFLTGDLSAVISEPNEPRPRSTRRADMAKYLDARASRGARK